MQGHIDAGQFRVEFFRREATVESFHIGLADKPENQPIKGLVRFSNNDYLVFLDILGTAGKPLYVFRSEPPLAQNEIIAVVLFGRTPTELDVDQMQSVDDMRGALADGAVNLLSMYYLATTPVESIGYNPQTKIFSARVRIQDGLSFSVGSYADTQSQVGIKKRLGGGWSVETSGTHDEATNTNRGSAMLKWGKRY
jgi:hypothetical protein